MQRQLWFWTTVPTRHGSTLQGKTFIPDVRFCSLTPAVFQSATPTFARMDGIWATEARDVDPALCPAPPRRESRWLLPHRQYGTASDGLLTA